MKAIAYQQSLPIEHVDALIDIELQQPQASGQDLLVKVEAIAVNPVDYKIRQRMAPEAGEYRVLGWDAVGEVIACGEQVQGFQPGDKVYYAGDLNRQGSNAEYQLVDARLAGHKPKSLSDSEAAALPLTAITAWELLFDHLALAKTDTDNSAQKPVLLIVGAAGGVGSIMIQLAKALTDATVIATASRTDSQNWVKQLGADYVIDHRQPLDSQIAELNIGAVTHIASLNATDSYYQSYIDLLAPFGKIGLIDDPKTAPDVMLLKPKSLSIHFEFMYARSMFNAADMDEQGKLLNRVAELIDSGHIKTTVGKHLGKINADNLKAAHAELEAGTAIGKLVLEGF